MLGFFIGTMLTSLKVTMLYHFTSDWCASLVRGDTVVLKATQPLMKDAIKGVYFTPDDLWHYASGEGSQGKYALAETHRPICVLCVKGDYDVTLNTQEEREVVFTHDLRLQVSRVETITRSIGRSWMAHSRVFIYLYCEVINV